MPDNHLLILTESPFSKRDYDRFGVQVLSRYFAISALDCTPWLTPHFWEKSSDIAFRFPGYKEVKNLNSFRALLDQPVRTIAIDYLGYGAKTRRIRSELKKQGIVRSVVRAGLIPEPAIPVLTRMRRLIVTPGSSISEKILDRIRRAVDPQTPEVVLMSGISGFSNDLKTVRHVIWAHSFDYDLYLMTKDSSELPTKRYAVFLDEDMPWHSDYENLGLRTPVTPRAYYSSMNRFFDKFERQHGLRVVIAAHPRSRYDLRPDVWGGRVPIYAKTALLVRDADVVLCHASTSISFAVLWRKEILHLMTDELLQSSVAPYVAMFSRELGARQVNIDNETDVADALITSGEPNEQLYTRYVTEYIKRPGTPEIPMWQIFAEYVQDAVF